MSKCKFQVECSLENSFKKGMKLEVSVKPSPGTCWLARLEMAAGQLLRLRWEGMEDGADDFWSDAFSSDVHALGWCKENGRVLAPPPCKFV